MDRVYKDIKNCCGCALCEDVCPKNAISMNFYDGFSYPVIDKSLCTDCGLCEKKCPFNKEKLSDSNCLEAFAVKHRNEDVINKSSSGGIFTALSDKILGSDGAVIGAVFNKNMDVVHSVAENTEERDKMRGSKYIQSDTKGIYAKIRELLKEEKTVLFTGTPCEAAAVRTVFPDEENLYIVDIICHGVPSPEVWKNYVSYIEKSFGKKLTAYSFRDKETTGWRSYGAKLTFSDGTTEKHGDITGSFIELFRYDVCMRPSCTVCSFASLHRQGDITIGDFWGIENILPDFSDNKGISAVMLNTEKGKKLFYSIKEAVTPVSVTQSDIAKKQPNLSRPSSFSNKREAFQQDLKAMPFEKVLKKYTRAGTKRKLIDLTKKIIGKA